MLKQPVTVRRQKDKKGDHFVLHHPVAKTVLKQKSASKWLNCKQNEAQAEESADNVKADWEAKLQLELARCMTASLCLCSGDSCAQHADDNISHVTRWNLIPQNSLVDAVLQMHEERTSRDWKRVCEHVIKDPGKGADNFDDI